MERVGGDSAAGGAGSFQTPLNPQVETSETGGLDFGDLPGGSAKSLPLRLLNRTRATVPIRLVISAVSEVLFTSAVL